MLRYGARERYLAEIARGGTDEQARIAAGIPWGMAQLWQQTRAYNFAERLEAAESSQSAERYKFVRAQLLQSVAMHTVKMRNPGG